MPTIIVIAGPNGAGKTTFAREYLAAEERQFEFVNADEIALGLNGPSDVLAGRMMLDRIDRLVDLRSDFAIETTLASLGYARKIAAWRGQDYLVAGLSAPGQRRASHRARAQPRRSRRTRYTRGCHCPAFCKELALLRNHLPPPCRRVVCLGES